jgi:hypothetical protein
MKSTRARIGSTTPSQNLVDTEVRGFIRDDLSRPPTVAEGDHLRARVPPVPEAVEVEDPAQPDQPHAQRLRHVGAP